MMFTADGRSKIYRFGGGSVMVWTTIHHDGRTALVRVNGALNAQIASLCSTN